MQIWIDFVTTRIIPAFHRFLQFQPSESSPHIDPIRDEYLIQIKEFVCQMSPHGPFFAGQNPQLVDFIPAPWAIRHWVFDHFKGGLGVPAQGHGGTDEATWTRWRIWIAALQERQSVMQTTSEKEYYLSIYAR